MKFLKLKNFQNCKNFKKHFLSSLLPAENFAPVLITYIIYSWWTSCLWLVSPDFFGLGLSLAGTWYCKLGSRESSRSRVCPWRLDLRSKIFVFAAADTKPSLYDYSSAKTVNYYHRAYHSSSSCSLQF